MSSLSLLLRFRLATASGRLIRYAAASLLLCLPLSAQCADPSDLSDETRACLKCHDKPGLSKRLDDGEALSLHVSTTAFLASRHAETDCEDCHDDLDADTHGKIKGTIKSRRAYSESMRDSCRECHKKNAKSYGDGVHAALILAGSDKAPFCADCHEPHTLLSVKTPQAMEDTACVKCHKPIYTAYAQDVHGRARAKHGEEAPLCADCHRAHDIKAASYGTTVRDACLKCHEDADAEHREWLPNTARHFEAISCAACHAPKAQRRVNLRLFDATSGEQMAEKTGVPQFREAIEALDIGTRSLDERALLSLLKQFSQEGGGQRVVLRGRLEVTDGIDAHRISDGHEALKSCDFCHAANAEPFQRVTITMAGPDGRPLRHGVNKEVLNSLVSIESVRGFYAIGANRIRLLDWLLLAAVAASIGGCALHWGVRRAFRRARERAEADARRTS